MVRENLILEIRDLGSNLFTLSVTLDIAAQIQKVRREEDMDNRALQTIDDCGWQAKMCEL